MIIKLDVKSDRLGLRDDRFFYGLKTRNSNSYSVNNLPDVLFQDTVTVRVTKLTKSFGFNLADAFAGYIEDLANFFEGFHTTII